MSSRPGESPYLLGNFANSISLATGVRSINDKHGTRDLEWKLAEYQPSYYVTLGRGGKIRGLITAVHGLELIAAYDVYASFRDPDPEEVYFYAVAEKAPSDTAQSGGGARPARAGRSRVQTESRALTEPREIVPAEQPRKLIAAGCMCPPPRPPRSSHEFETRPLWGSA